MSLCPYVAVSPSSFVDVSLFLCVLCRCVPVSLCRCVAEMLYDSVAVSLYKTMITKFSPVSDKKCIYSRASVNYDRQTIFAIIDRRFLQNSNIEISKKKNQTVQPPVPAHGRANGRTQFPHAASFIASSRMPTKRYDIKNKTMNC